MKIKICGITNLEDALYAAYAGADALGFVFYDKSPRYIDPLYAKDIITQLPPFVQSVGLFVNHSADEINSIASISKIDLAQIHFDISHEEYKQINVKKIKVVRVQNKNDLINLREDFYLVDAFVENYGGEGKRINLDWFQNIDCSKLILAGGLNAENLSQLNGFGFYGVDVSSGVESSKGKKDPAKIKDFIIKANEIS